MDGFNTRIETADEIDHGMARFEYCLEAVIYRFEDGYVLCPLLWSGARGCEECMEIWEKEMEHERIDPGHGDAERLSRV